VLSVKCVLLNLRKECVTVSMDIYRNPVNLRNVSLCVGRKRERFLINYRWLFSEVLFRLTELDLLTERESLNMLKLCGYRI